MFARANPHPGNIVEASSLSVRVATYLHIVDQYSIIWGIRCIRPFLGRENLGGWPEAATVVVLLLENDVMSVCGGNV